MMRPNVQDCMLKNYFINELNQLENFYNKNIDFYKSLIPQHYNLTLFISS